MIQRGCLGTAAWHFQVAVGIRLLEPIPCVVKPLAPISLALIGKPTDFVITPYPICTLSRLTWMLAGAIVIQLDEIGVDVYIPSRCKFVRLCCEERRCRDGRLPARLPVDDQVLLSRAAERHGSRATAGRHASGLHWEHVHCTTPS